MEMLTDFKTRFTTFFEQSHLPMKILSLEGRVLAVNKAWERLFSTSREELLDYNIFSDPQIKNTKLWDYIQRAYKGESVEIPAFFYDPKNSGKAGRSRWLEAWLSPVKDEDHRIHEVAMILKDVTDKIETQKALIKSISDRKATEEKYQILSERLSLAVKTGNIGIWEWIPYTSHVSWDETAEKIFGYDVKSLPDTERAFIACIHPDERDNVWSKIEEAIKEKRSYTVEHRIIRQDGVQRWVQGSGMALYDERGVPYHMMGTVIDLTEKKLAEDDQKFLSETSDHLMGSFDYKEILKNLCEHANRYFCEGCFVDRLLPDGRVERLMVSHKDLFLSRQIMEIGGKVFPHSEEDHPFIKALISGKPLLIDYGEYIGGEKYYRDLLSLEFESSITTRLKGRESVLGIITFFTLKNSGKKLTSRHIWIAEELASRASMAYENALMHQDSQEAIRSRDEFLSIASHELKTPLQSLTLQNQMRKRNLDKNLMTAFSSERMVSMIDADLRHLRRINRLIDDMLDISRLRAGRLTFFKEKVAFVNFVKDVLERFRPQMDAAGCMLSTSYSPEVSIEMDHYRIEQVLVNLLTNATKYGAGKPVRVEVKTSSDRVQVLVTDKGPGIKEEDRGRIFQRFERAISSNEVSGLGLGLYISRQIMEQHQGRLDVLSAPGPGSTFIVELPLDKND